MHTGSNNVAGITWFDIHEKQRRVYVLGALSAKSKKKK